MESERSAANPAPKVNLQGVGQNTLRALWFVYKCRQRRRLGFWEAGFSRSCLSRGRNMNGFRVSKKRLTIGEKCPGDGARRNG
jgi:hypothetical protein